jgi:hypothetical protein
MVRQASCSARPGRPEDMATWIISAIAIAIVFAILFSELRRRAD